MKTLYLVRHAKALSRTSPLPDFDRPLSERGHRDARTAAALLTSVGPWPTLLISSPAQRALATTAIFAHAYLYPSDKIETVPGLYAEYDVDGVGRLVHSLDDAHECVMLCGHNPVLSDYARSLQPELDTDLPTCGLRCFELPTSSWAEVSSCRAVLRYQHAPSKQTTKIPGPAELQAQLLAGLTTVVNGLPGETGRRMLPHVEKVSRQLARSYAKLLKSLGNG